MQNIHIFVLRFTRGEVSEADYSTASSGEATRSRARSRIPVSVAPSITGGRQSRSVTQVSSSVGIKTKQNGEWIIS